MSASQEMRCPKTGEAVSEMECTYCVDQPEGPDPDDAYSACRKFNEESYGLCRELYFEAINTVTQWDIIEQLVKQYLLELINREARY